MKITQSSEMSISRDDIINLGFESASQNHVVVWVLSNQVHFSETIGDFGHSDDLIYDFFCLLNIPSAPVEQGSHLFISNDALYFVYERRRKTKRDFLVKDLIENDSRTPIRV